MGSRVRFFGAGVAVSAICFLLYSMTWQYVLGLFVLASVGGVVWSWLAESDKDRQRARAERAKVNEISHDRSIAPEGIETAERIELPVSRKRTVMKGRAAGGESRARKSGNIVQFPGRKRASSERSNGTEASD